jgi:GNAT superfamily N-acetyltransferase
MTKIEQVEEMDELVKCWPRLFSIAYSEGLRIDADDFLRMFLRCMADGAVFFVRGDKGLCGACCVEDDNDVLKLRLVPKDKGTGVAKECMKAIREWARVNGYSGVEVTTNRFSGSSFWTLEKTLGFRRHSVTFRMAI